MLQENLLQLIIRQLPHILICVFDLSRARSMDRPQIFAAAGFDPKKHNALCPTCAVNGVVRQPLALIQAFSGPHHLQLQHWLM